ncbi:abnormal spindle-like microcephaly-associated protein [Aplochiton taeniatus]
MQLNWNCYRQQRKHSTNFEFNTVFESAICNIWNCQKTLWDSIKKKRGADPSASVRSKKSDTSLKTAVNKTFHVSRKPQYKREKPRSPLAPVNDKLWVRERSLSRCSPVEDPSDWPEKQKTKPSQRQRSLGLSDQTNAQKNSPVVLLVPAIKVIDSSDKANSLQVGTPEHRELLRVLNRTLSPVGTPERRKNLMPCIQSVQSNVTEPPPNVPDECKTVLTGTPVLSVRDALAFIESDLTHVVGASPPNACSSFDFSDSLPSANGESAALGAKKAPFISVTVTKSKTVSETVQESSPGGAHSLKSFTGASTRKTKVIAVAQSKLTFIKSAPTAIPRHPMPFAAKNMFYDERWIEKQERGFTWWINYVLTPDDFKVNTEVTKVNAVSLAMGGNDKFSVPKAPTKEEMSFSTYTARRRLNRLRRAACHLFTSDSMAKAIQRLELEVEAKRLLVRKDRHLWKDIGERQKVLNWLLSYNPLWLRIGLETIYGEMMSLESNSDVMGLALFILRRLLWNPDLAAEYRHANVPHLYKDGHEEVLSRFTLKKLLLLVCFLDKAKESRLIEHDPCLFCMDAEFKTSKDLLLAFSRDFLSGEGILPRHLGYLGLPVSHAQTPLDEFNFAVKNLAVDLKCGVRLVRVMELFIQDWSLSRKLRIPAISRLQKVHNVDIALQVLKTKDVDLKDDHGAVIESRDIVDGHREKTLALLWKIIFAFQVEVILDEEQLKEEISFLKRTWRTKQRLASLRADKGGLCKPAKPWAPFQHSSPKITLLMDWVNAVSDFYNLKVENFTVSFSDGRALCYLIHHYHPSQLPLERVCQDTTQTVECSQRGRVQLNCSSSDSENSFDGWPTTQSSDSPCMEFKELQENEKENFRLVKTAVSFLGGVPAMINPSDMSNTIPNEKVVMSYLSFLCARLLDLRNETRAARAIQGGWRKYRLRKDLQLYQERSVAAAKIQVQVRAFLQRRRAQRQRSAAVGIQAVWRGYAARNALRQKRRAEIQAVRHRAATLIQAHWKRYLSMRDYQCLTYHVIVVQGQWRMQRAVSAYRRIQWASAVIQSHFRAWALAKIDRGRYLSLRRATVIIQRSYRRRRSQQLQRENHAAQIIQSALRKWHKDKMRRKSAAALKIQTWYRMLKCQTRYVKVKNSAALIQARYRGYVQRHSFKMLQRQHFSATVIQSAFRAHAVRQRLEKRNQASVTIQRWFRASLQRDKVRQTFINMRSAAVIIQAAYRGRMARKLLKSQHWAATIIQTSWRRFVFQKKYGCLKKAAIVIQQRFRAKVLCDKLREEYVCLKKAVQITQAVWRGRVDRKRMEKLHRRATLIQACYRHHAAQTQYRSTRAAALVIQRRFRAYTAGKNARKRYLSVRESATILQAGLRGMMARKDLRKKHHAATVLQSAVRAFLCRRRYALLQSAAIILQSHYRARQEGKMQRQKYNRLRQAVVKLQAASRGLRVRKDLRRTRQAATVIQAQFRMYKVKVAYLATKCAALIIQERYRANKLRDQQAQQYKAMKSAAIVIQAAHRGHRARVVMAEINKAATVIQRRFLTLRSRKRFLVIKSAVILCQRRYRAVTMMRKDRKHYRSKQGAAIVLQAAFRGMKVRQLLHRECTAAITIQSHLRKHQQRTYYKKLQRAASTVQARYRALKQMREEMHTLTTKRSAATVLQAAFRGLKSRQHFGEMRKAASVVQRAFRAHLERKRYLALRSSVLAVQQRYRASVAAKQQMQQYQKMRNSAILLQAVYRGQRARKHVVRRHRAAAVIQAAFRKHRKEVKFQAMRLSAIMIQRFYRSCVQKRQDRERFLKLRRSALVVQAAFRAQRTRRSIAKLHKAATTIQSHYKMKKQLSAFKRQRWAACVLQQRFRALRQRNVEMQKYQQVRNSVILLQAAYRDMRSRQNTRQKNRVAGVIQRAYRAYRIRKEYLSFKSSIVIVQQRYRASVAAKQQMQQYQKMRNSAILLQAVYRGQRARKHVVRRHRAAAVIQAAFRKHRKEVKFQAMRLSAIMIQRFYRSCVQKRQDRERFLKLRRSALVVQAAFRAQRTRRSIAKLHKAATTIQSHYKMKKQLSAFKRQRWAACVLQQRFRAQTLRNLERQKYQQLHHAVICVQASFRGNKARRLAQQARAARKILSFLTMSVRRRQFLKAKAAALTIQSIFRGHQARARYRKKQASAITIQRWYRSHQMARRQRSEFVATREAAVKVQSAVRGYIAAKRYQRLMRSAVTIQAFYRGMVARQLFQRKRASALTIQKHNKAHLLCQREMAKYAQMKKSALLIQAGFRGHLARRKFAAKQRGVATIHRCLQAKLLRKRFVLIQRSVKVLQGRWRETLKTKEERKHFLKMKVAAVHIQAAWRGHQARHNLLKEHRAAGVIQCCYRSRAQRLLFLRKREAALVIQRRLRALHLARTEREGLLRPNHAAVVLQAHVRGWIVRKKMQEKAQAERRKRFCSAVFHHLCATRIQRAWRAYRTLQSAKKQIHSVILLQRWTRARQQRKRYLEDRARVVTAQKAARRWLARRHGAAAVIQRAAQRFLLFRRQQRVQRGIVKAQALWRGHRSRVLQDNPKVVALRRRLRQLSTDVQEEDRLCNKMASALEYFLQYKHFSYILEALKSLETATRLSPECCERLVESGATRVIFTLIRSCNRSIPCMEVISYAIQILLNLSKYHKTIEEVYAVENSVDTLLDLLQIYREKAGDKVVAGVGTGFTPPELRENQVFADPPELPSCIFRHKKTMFLFLTT